MEILLAALLFLVGAGVIIKGGDIFVDAAGWMSDVTGISKVVIGATIVSLATTSPEYFVSLIATLKGFNDLSIGNAVGSLIANLGIAFSLLALFTPGSVNDRLFGIKGVLMLAATSFLLLFCLNGRMSIVEGVVLMIIFGISIFVNIRFSKNEEGETKRKKTNSKEILINIIKFVLGAAGIVLGSNLIVDNGQVIASFMGVSEAVIGLTVVAVGTSLPEVITSITAIIKKQNALSIGNIIGANILDATMILATGAFISNGNLTVSSDTVTTDLPVALFLMVVAVLPTAITKKINRYQGIIMATVYIGYLIYLALMK